MKNCLKFLILGACTILAINSASGDPNLSDNVDRDQILEKLADLYRRLRALEKVHKKEKENFQQKIDQHTNEIEKQTKEITTNQLNIEKNEAKIKSFSGMYHLFKCKYSRTWN